MLLSQRLHLSMQNEIIAGKKRGFMDLGIIIAIVGSAIAIIGVTITMMLWIRSESRSDWRNLQDQITGDRRDFIHVIRSIELAIGEIKSENKDFHFRLLEIERQRKVS